MPSNIEYVKGATDLSLTGTYSGGALPIDGDSLFFSDGGGVVNTNMNALAAIDLARFELRPGFFADIGEAGNPMEIDVDRTSTGIAVLGSRSSKCFFKGGSGSGIWNDLTVQMVNGSAQVWLQSLSLNAMRVYSGVVRCPATVALGTCDVLGPGTVIADAHASDTIGNGTIANGGTLIARRRISGSIVVGLGGTLIYDVDTATTTGTITLAGGRIELRKGSMTVSGLSGELDYSKLEKATSIAYTLTITDHEGLIEKSGSVLPTFSRTTPGKGSRKIPV